MKLFVFLQEQINVSQAYSRANAEVLLNSDQMHFYLWGHGVILLSRCCVTTLITMLFVLRWSVYMLVR